MSAEATRMQDLASEFSKKISGGNTPGLPQREGRPPPAPTPARPLASASAPVLGHKPWSPQLFSCGCAPGPYMKLLPSKILTTKE